MLSMLTAEGCAGRRARLWQRLPEPCDALIITTPESLTYLANYVQSPFVFNSAEACAALVLWPDRAVLIGDNLTQPFLDQAHVDEVVCLDWYTGRKSAPLRRAVVVDAVADQFAGKLVRRLGIESLSIVSAPANRECNLDSVLRQLRRTKDDDELAAGEESPSRDSSGA